MTLCVTTSLALIKGCERSGIEVAEAPDQRVFLGA